MAEFQRTEESPAHHAARHDGVSMIYPALPGTVDSGIDKDEKLTYEFPSGALLSELSEFAR